MKKIELKNLNKSDIKEETYINGIYLKQLELLLDENDFDTIKSNLFYIQREEKFSFASALDLVLRIIEAIRDKNVDFYVLENLEKPKESILLQLKDYYFEIEEKEILGLISILYHDEMGLFPFRTKNTTVLPVYYNIKSKIDQT